MGIQYGYTVRSDGEVNVKVPRGSVALLLTVRKPLSSTLPYKEEALELLKGRKTYMKWFALRLNPIRNSRWPLVAYLISHILLIKWKKNKYPTLSPLPKKMTQSLSNLYFQAMWSPRVRAPVSILQKGPGSQGSVRLVGRPFSPELGILRMLCFCFGSGCSKLTVIWKHLFFPPCVMA